jgi:hypothetical protein
MEDLGINKKLAERRVLEGRDHSCYQSLVGDYGVLHVLGI